MFVMIICGQQESVKVVFILSSVRVRGQRDCLIDIEDGGLPYLSGLVLLGQVTKSINGSLLLCIVAFCKIICLLQLLDVRYKLGFADRFDQR